MKTLKEKIYPTPHVRIPISEGITINVPDVKEVWEECI
jgi:hypothetical protein